MKMSYTRAWGLVEAMNHDFAAPLVHSAKGGAGRGGATLTAHLTPGHTKGATTWTWKAGGLDVVLVSSASILDYRFVGEESYPGIRADFEKSFATFAKLPARIFLAPHAGFIDLETKRAKLGGESNPFVDPAGYRSWVDRAEISFREAVEKQRLELAAVAPAAP